MVAIPTPSAPPFRLTAPRVLAWVAYDWAFSAFNTVVVTFVIATYFVQAVAPDPATGTAQWAATQAIAGLVIALLAAPLGVLADLGGHRRPLLIVLTLALVVCTALLWFVRPGPADAHARHSGWSAPPPSARRSPACSTTPCCPSWRRPAVSAGCRASPGGPAISAASSASAPACSC